VQESRSETHSCRFQRGDGNTTGVKMNKWCQAAQLEYNRGVM